MIEAKKQNDMSALVEDEYTKAMNFESVETPTRITRLNWFNSRTDTWDKSFVSGGSSITCDLTFDSAEKDVRYYCYMNPSLLEKGKAFYASQGDTLDLENPVDGFFYSAYADMLREKALIAGENDFLWRRAPANYSAPYFYAGKKAVFVLKRGCFIQNARFDEAEKSRKEIPAFYPTPYLEKNGRLYEEDPSLCSSYGYEDGENFLVSVKKSALDVGFFFTPYAAGDASHSPRVFGHQCPLSSFDGKETADTPIGEYLSDGSYDDYFLEAGENFSHGRIRYAPPVEYRSSIQALLVHRYRTDTTFEMGQFDYAGLCSLIREEHQKNKNGLNEERVVAFLVFS